MIDLMDPFKVDAKPTSRLKNASNTKLGSYQNTQLSAERIYINKNTKMAREMDKFYENLDQRSAKKPSRSKKTSQSQNYRRFNITTDFLAPAIDFPKTICSNCGLNSSFENIRREPDLYKNNQNSLLAMVKKYTEKEKKWNSERKQLRNDML